MYRYIIPLILAGGKSSRMGSNKFLIKIKEKSFLEKINENLLEIGFLKIIINGNNCFGYNFLTDYINNLGPISALKIFQKILKKFNKCIIMPCDMPLIDKKNIFLYIFFFKKKIFFIKKKFSQY